MNNTELKIFIVTYDRILKKAVESLSNEELETITSYNIQKKIKKNIDKKIKYHLNEWDLSWNDPSYQLKQYYEYSIFPHLFKNQELIQNNTHIGVFHYDIIFQSNAIENTTHHLNKNPNTIFYQRIRNKKDLYLTEYEVNELCSFLKSKIPNTYFDPNKIWENGWVSECLSIVPKKIALEFGKFLFENKKEIESILLENKWGIMNNINHRICGIVERMWGFYLVSCGLITKKIDIIHDWDSYQHKHTEEKNWINS